MRTPFQGSEAGQGIEVSCARLHLELRRAELV
jgi:hypothetical protein